MSAKDVCEYLEQLEHRIQELERIGRPKRIECGSGKLDNPPMRRIILGFTPSQVAVYGVNYSVSENAIFLQGGTHGVDYIYVAVE